MKKLLIGLCLIFLATGAFAVQQGQGLGDIIDQLTVSTALTAEVEGYSVDIVTMSDTQLADNDTMSFVFSFTPSRIVVTYHYRGKHDTSGEEGSQTGTCDITVTAVDTITGVLNAVGGVDQNGAFKTYKVFNDTTNIINANAGYDGADWGTNTAPIAGAWTTATNTLVLDFTCTNTDPDANDNGIGVTAIAYK